MKSILTNFDVMFYPFIIIVLYGTYHLSIYVISIPIGSFITLLIVTLGVFGLVTFVITKLSNVMMTIYKNFAQKKYNDFKDKNGNWDERKEKEYFRKVVSFKKIFYWNFSLIILLTYIILIPIYNWTGKEYFLLIILYTLLVCDYFLRKFALDFVRTIKIKNSHLYAEPYWEETKHEEFFAPFLQIFLIPIIMFSIIHFNVSVYNIINLTSYFDIFKTVLTFSGVFTFIFWFSLILSRFKKKSDTFLEYMFREYFNFILPDV